MRQLDLANTEPRRPSVFDDPEHYPGIVLRQPYAGLMRLGLKTIETRKTPIRYRGPLVIIAGLNEFAEATIEFQSLIRSGRVGGDAYWNAVELKGVAVAIVDAVGCRQLEPGRWAWLTDNLRELKPFPVKGHQGFVRVPRALVDAAVEVRRMHRRRGAVFLQTAPQ